MKLKIVKKNKVLSLFDGMACGMLAMQKANILVGDYFAYEIDRYAIKTVLHNFPNIKELGNVFDEDFSKYVGVDFLIGGSPCTYWSIAQSPNKRETTASGLGWELFSQYTKALQEAKPKYFIYENNKSMAKAIYESISESFGFEPIMINSALVSAQNRQRYYWVGKRNEDGTYSKVDIEQPEDKGILLKDILDNSTVAKPVGTTIDDKSHTIKAQYYKNSIANFITNEGFSASTVAEPAAFSMIGDLNNRKVGTKDKAYCLAANPSSDMSPRVIEPVTSIQVGALPRPNGELSKSQAFRIYDINAKSVTLKASGGGAGGKTGLYAIPVEFEGDIPIKAISYANGKTYKVHEVKDGLITIKGKQYPIKLQDGYYIIRKLTVSECKRLQTVPKWYEFPVSDTQAYKMLGNGWTVDVISHILKCIKGDI